ncbi:MAG TPA: PEPxxWA-CTERM sorting domain-containing protein [Sphingomonas sp.]|nr:PEPxxWA-CTERM sorting domain-containing protein [Sphingomonas sp.]
MTRNRLLIALLSTLALATTPAHGATVSDAVGDFVPGFIGPNSPDLDVTSFSVGYNSATSTFILGASFAGAIDPSVPGFYVIGVNTGTGTLAPFASLGQPNVIFNQAIVVRKDGTGNIGATALAPGTITISGNTLSALIPLSLLPSTGFVAERYGFNLWPRVATGNNNQISDFAPDNATLAVVPEPASWLLMLSGFAVVAGALRYRRRRPSLTIAPGRATRAG